MTRGFPKVGPFHGTTSTYIRPAWAVGDSLEIGGLVSIRNPRGESLRMPSATDGSGGTLRKHVGKTPIPLLEPPPLTTTIPSLKLTSKAPENGWLEDDPFLLGVGLFSGAMLISGRVRFKGCSKLPLVGLHQHISHQGSLLDPEAPWVDLSNMPKIHNHARNLWET